MLITAKFCSSSFFQNWRYLSHMRLAIGGKADSSKLQQRSACVGARDVRAAELTEYKLTN